MKSQKNELDKAWHVIITLEDWTFNYEKLRTWFQQKSYVFLKFYSHLERFQSVRTVLHWLDIFYVSPCKKLFSDLYLFVFEHNLENK